MRIDVEEFHEFYNSPPGRLVHKILRAYLEHLYPNVEGLSIAGYGYALPYLASFHKEAERAIALMPAPLGAMPWPDQNQNRVVLCESKSFPLPDDSIHLFFLLHGLEYTDHMRSLLREIWRVLTPGGRLIIATPNRRGVWARRTNTPLGYGHPFTGGQLVSLLATTLFSSEKPHYCVFTPPTFRRSILNLCDSFEKYGQKWFTKLGGMVIVQAQKQILAPLNTSLEERRRRIFIPTPVSSLR